jgi:hypothetical protein
VEFDAKLINSGDISGNIKYDFTFIEVVARAVSFLNSYDGRGSTEIAAHP